MSNRKSIKSELPFDQKALGWLDALSRRLKRTHAVAPHLVVGLRGEEMAFFYLRQRGYVVVARRWKTPKVNGDVDLIAWDGDTLCFVEVKTRTARNIVPAEFAVDQQKQKMLRSMASVFKKRLPEEKRQQVLVRFDVVSVYLSGRGSLSGRGRDSAAEIELFPAAFSTHPG